MTDPGALAAGFVIFTRMMKILLMIDGGFLRVRAKRARMHFSPDFIESFAAACTCADEELLRVLYYDCAPYRGEQTLPISRQKEIFNQSPAWLYELARKNRFAIRLGVLKFRGYKLKKLPKAGSAALTDKDFYADFEQKGVDMRIGLDIASYSANSSVERIGLVTADTDCVPAMKLARKSGLQIVLITPPGLAAPDELAQHSDFVRPVVWPEH